MTEIAVTLPIEVVESLIRVAQILHPGNLKPHDKAMLAIAVEEVGVVRKMVEQAARKPSLWGFETIERPQPPLPPRQPPNRER